MTTKIAAIYRTCIIFSGLHGPEALVELFESAKEKAEREAKEKARIQEENRKREQKRLEREAKKQKATKAGLERFKRHRRRQSDSSSSGGEEDASSPGQGFLRVFYLLYAQFLINRQIT